MIMNIVKRSIKSSGGLLLVTSFLSAPLAAADLDKRVEILERRLSGLSDLMLQVDALKRENSQLRGQIEEQNHNIESLKKRQRDLYIDIDSRLSRLQTPAPAAVVSPPPPLAKLPAEIPAAETAATSQTAPIEPKAADNPPVVQKSSASISVDEQAEYDAAFKLLTPSQKRYGDAIVALKQFLVSYPDSALADNAQYWLAEANYVSRQNEQALLEFDKLISLYPNSSKVSGAMLKKGYLQHSAGQLQEASQTLQKVVNDYPGTAAANMAKNRLTRIQSEQ